MRAAILGSGSWATAFGRHLAHKWDRVVLWGIEAEQVESINADLARYEQIKQFALLPNELTTDGGELTPTMKLKRRVIHETYASIIESLYA